MKLNKIFKIPILFMFTFILLLCSEIEVEAKLGPVYVNGGQRDFKWPVPSNYGLVSCFLDPDAVNITGERSNYHYALDISAEIGTNVIASYSGTVIQAVDGGPSYNGDGFGNYVVIEHNYKLSNGNTITLYSRYSHLNSVSVSKGSTVNAGTVIGKVGKSGFQYGPHLDFQILRNGWNNYTVNSIDPYANNLLELPNGIYKSATTSCCQTYINEIKELYSKPLVSPTLTVKDATFPDAILQGDTYVSTGKIESNEKITWAWIGILDMSTEQYVTHDEVAPNAKTYDILTSTKKLKISSLKPGKYKFCISATTESGYNKSRMIAKEFTVVSLDTKGVTFPDTIEQGKGYASAGEIVSNEKITWAWVGVLDMDTELYVTSDKINPNTTSYDISASTRKLNVSSLEPGKYKFCISATTESGINRTKMIAKEFTVVESNKITFDLQGGSVGEYFASHDIANINGARTENTLVVYDNANAISNTNTYGSEALINDKGTVTGFRGFGSEDKLTVPTDGMIVSGHSEGRTFISKLTAGNYVGFDREAMKVYAYDDYDAYLVNHKYVMAGSLYEELPVPEKAGYYFVGWFTDKTGGEEITTLSPYSVNKLYARWSETPQPVNVVSYNGHTYEVYDYSMSWEDAKKFCELRGGHLVTVTSKDENAQLINLISKGKRGYYLIGAESKEVQGSWNWVSGENFSYSNWDTQSVEGNTAAERYAAIISIDCPPNKQNGEWIDIHNVIDTPNYYYYYSNCGFVCEIESVEHIHTIVKTNRVEPTCTTDGKTEGSYCSSCGETIKKQEVIKANGHSWDTKYTVDKEATCKDAGSKSIHCLNCKERKSVTAINALGHSFKKYVSNGNATCTKDGTSTAKCERCNTYDTIVEKGSAKGHTWDKGVVTKPTTDEQGYTTYTCTVCGDIKKDNYTNMLNKEVIRVYGATRYETAFMVADALKQQLGVNKFNAVIVTSGENFADALAGSYLAANKSAPILLTNGKNISTVHSYIKNNLASGGTVYILGGVNAVSANMENGLTGYNIKRLQGADRYATNLAILNEAGVSSEDIMICTGNGFADSLSASATGKPILLVNKSLTTEQKTFLKNVSGNNCYILGGTSAISDSLEKQIDSYVSGSLKRLGGATRYETSVLLAQTFFNNADAAVLAYAMNYPDGLSGGPLAESMKGPLILTATDVEKAAAGYVSAKGIKSGIVIGGPGLISDKAVRNIFSLSSSEKIEIWIK